MEKGEEQNEECGSNSFKRRRDPIEEVKVKKESRLEGSSEKRHNLPVSGGHQEDLFPSADFACSLP